MEGRDTNVLPEAIVRYIVAFIKYISNSLILDRSGFKLPSRVVLVALSTDETPVLAFPDEYKSEEQYN